MINNVKERVGKRIFKGDIREQEKIKRVGAQKIDKGTKRGGDA